MVKWYVSFSTSSNLRHSLIGTLLLGNSFSSPERSNTRFYFVLGDWSNPYV